MVVLTSPCYFLKLLLRVDDAEPTLFILLKDTFKRDSFMKAVKSSHVVTPITIQTTVISIYPII